MIGHDTAMDPYSDDSRVRGYVDRLVHPFGEVPSVIDPDDDMYRYNLDSLRGCHACAAILYYSKGWQIFSTIREVAAWRFGSLRNLASLLDVGSGHGRVTRFLVGEVEPSRICVAEVRPAAIEFQKRAFGVRGAVTRPEPASLVSRSRFDCIVAASFFSHLPEGRFRGWMKRLVDLLDEGGLLLLSTHGAALLNSDSGDLANGIAFVPASEARDLDGSEYGTSYVTAEFVERVVAEATDGRGKIRHFPRGLCGYQDLFVVAKDGSTRLETLAVTQFPWGEVDRSSLESNRLVLEGWVEGGNGPSSLPSVRLTVNNVERGAWSPREAGDRRWRIDVDRSDIGWDDVLIASARNEQGLENILAMGTLRPYLAPDG